jgi:hypothetical protein
MNPYPLMRDLRLGSVRRKLGQDELVKLFRPGGQEDDYSLKPFVLTKSLFVHLPKTAGVSISRALYGCLGMGHLTLADYRDLFRPRAFARMFKFTFVRNPFDRIHSAYHFLRSGGMGGLDAQFNEQVLKDFHSFEQFVMEGLDRQDVSSFWHFLPDTHFLSYRPGHAVELDFVGRYERLERDFDYVRSRVSPAARLGYFNRAAAREDYRRAYTPEMIDRVAKRYAADLDLFGYRFDGLADEAADSGPLSTTRP